MSDLANTALIEEAGNLIDYWEGKLPSELMRADIETHDYESLHRHVSEARVAMYDLEYEPGEVTDVA